MSFDLSYSLLFEVNIFHNFFLNNGESVYENMPPAEKLKMIRKYDFTNFIAVNPSIATATILKNYKLHFKATNTGFKIFAKVKPSAKTDPFIKIPIDLELIFTLKITDSHFENYTDLTFSPNQLFYFSNAIPLRIESNEPIPEPNPKKVVFDDQTFNFIPLIDSNTLISNGFLASEKESINLLPDFENIETRGLFAAISISMKGHNIQNSVLNNQNKIISPTREFTIHFDNRKTFWKYINRRTATEIETTLAKPLTYSGFVEIDPTSDFNPAEPEENQYPNPSVKSIVKVNSKYYSEIFI